MSRHPVAAILVLTAAGASTPAVQLTLDRRAIEEAIYIGQSRIEVERSRFREPYRVRLDQPPVDWIDIVTPFHRVVLAAEANARAGRRQFGQREALDVLRESPNQIDLVVEMSFHPLNTFVAVPPYDVEIVRPGGMRVVPQQLTRFPRFGPRTNSDGPAVRPPPAAAAAARGQPVVGGTLIAAFDGTRLDPMERVEVIVLDGEKPLGQAALDLSGLR